MTFVTESSSLAVLTFYNKVNKAVPVVESLPVLVRRVYRRNRRDLCQSKDVESIEPKSVNVPKEVTVSSPQNIVLTSPVKSNVSREEVVVPTPHSPVKNVNPRSIGNEISKPVESDSTETKRYTRSGREVKTPSKYK